MKFIILSLIFIGLCIFPYSFFAADSDSGDQNSQVPLSLESIIPRDTMHIDVEFSSPVERDTLKLKIIKQSDNSAVKILSLSGGVDDAFTVRVNLETELVSGTAYTLTVISAVGQDGSVIRDGALALREFITPNPLIQYVDILNAPSNPNAVLVRTGDTLSTPREEVNTLPRENTVTPPSVPVKPKTSEPKVPEVSELPLTGMNPFLLLIFIFPFAFLYLRRKA